MKKYYAKPYMLPQNPVHQHSRVVGEGTLQEEYFVTDHMSMDSRHGLNKLNINQICVFRADLPSYPILWQEPMTMEMEIMIMIDPVESV